MSRPDDVGGPDAVIIGGMDPSESRRAEPPSGPGQPAPQGRRMAKPIRPGTDRWVRVDGRNFLVRLTRRFHPVLDPPPLHDFDFFRWLFWTLPATLIRRLVDRDGWTVTVFETSDIHVGWTAQQLHQEHARPLRNAAARADAIVEQLEDHAFRPARRPSVTLNTDD